MAVTVRGLRKQVDALCMQILSGVVTGVCCVLLYLKKKKGDQLACLENHLWLILLPCTDLCGSLSREMGKNELQNGNTALN